VATITGINNANVIRLVGAIIIDLAFVSGRMAKYENKAIQTVFDRILRCQRMEIAMPQCASLQCF
jgi:hypothetical protein